MTLNCCRRQWLERNVNNLEKPAECQVPNKAGLLIQTLVQWFTEDLYMPYVSELLNHLLCRGGTFPKASHRAVRGKTVFDVRLQSNKSTLTPQCFPGFVHESSPEAFTLPACHSLVMVKNKFLSSVLELA